MKRKFYLFCLFLPFSLNSFSQLSAVIPTTSNGQSVNFIPASPDAAGIGSFGQIPTSNFTGLPQINVPLYTVKYKELKVPIGISYNAAGNKPDNFPGSVGLGWSMDAPGAITRVVKGRIDEGGDLPPGSGPIAVITTPYTSDPNWNTNAYLSTLLTYKNAEAYDNSNPDEYYFNFNGVSGRFYFDYLDQAHVKNSSSFNLKVEKQVVTDKLFNVLPLTQSQADPDYHSTIHKDVVSYKFTLTDNEGIKYVFGGVDDAIEFSRPGLTRGDYPSGVGTDNAINPTTWYITSIESPNGYKIEFFYTRGLEVTKAPFTDVLAVSGFAATSAPIVNGIKSALINTSILAKIGTPKEEISFVSSEASQQLDYPYYEAGALDDGIPVLPDPKNFSWFSQYGDVRHADIKHKFPVKVDNILIKDKLGRLCRAINFNYTSDVNTRLKLMSLQIQGSNGASEAYPRYFFTYNDTPLPAYQSFKIDHYGFYNGRNTYAFLQNAGDYVSESFDRNAYNHSRDADPAYVQAEILTKITYPTGGNTTFSYEPNTYSSYFSTWPFQTISNPGNTEQNTGGVRIHSIINHDINGSIIGTKTYHYVKDYALNGTVSSGVKAYQPTYFESYIARPVNYPGTITPPGHYGPGAGYQVDYRKFSVNPIYPMGQTRGNHVTYSEVAEESADGSFIVYKYKNYDNGYGDKQPLNYVSDNIEIKDFYKEDEGISMDLERGQTLSEEYYDSNKAIKKKVEYQYNNDPTRFDDHVRVIAKSFNNPNDYGVPSIRYTASEIYTYFPYLREKTETDYNTNGNSITTTSYNYDVLYRNLKETTTEVSDESIAKTINRYPNDITNTADIYQNMINRHMVGKLLETERQVDGVKQSRLISTFDGSLSSNSALILPFTQKVQYRNGSEIVKSSLNKYDGMGNVLNASREKGLSTCYVWGYTGLYPIAKIENANYTDVESVLGGQMAVENFRDRIFPSDQDVKTYLAPLRTDIRLKNAYVTTFTYDPMAGMTSLTDVKGVNSYYDYDGMQRLKDVKDKDGNIIKYFCYNYAGQTVDCNVPSVKVSDFSYVSNEAQICAPNTLFREVRVYSPYGGSLLDGGFSYYEDRELTTPVPDGYYAISEYVPLGGVRHYLHIQGGVSSGFYSSCTLY